MHRATRHACLFYPPLHSDVAETDASDTHTHTHNQNKRSWIFLCIPSIFLCHAYACMKQDEWPMHTELDGQECRLAQATGHVSVGDTYRASRSDSSRARISFSRTGPLTLRIMLRVESSINSTRTWITPPREPVRPRTLVTCLLVYIHTLLLHTYARKLDRDLLRGGVHIDNVRSVGNRIPRTTT